MMPSPSSRHPLVTGTLLGGRGPSAPLEALQPFPNQRIGSQLRHQVPCEANTFQLGKNDGGSNDRRCGHV